MTARRRAAAAATAVLVVAGACSGGGGDEEPERAEPATTTSASMTTSTTGAPLPRLDWAACGDGAECTTVAVPVDHSDAGGPTLDLSVLRLPARGDRIGALFVNFGGPGSSAVAATPGFRWPDEVRDRFDIVAVDPRGVGESTPLDCGVPAEDLYALDHTVEDAEDEASLLGAADAYAADCERRHGSLLPHLGTRDVARDLDVVRAAIGDEQLSFLGYSYGTSVGQAYAELFPDRVRAMLLDGVVDTAPDGLTTAVEQAAGFEVALRRWASACGDRPSCDLEGPVDAVSRAIAAAEGGIPAGDRTLGPGQAAFGMAVTLYSESLWPSLDEAVRAALDGDGAPLLALADRFVELVEFDAYFAVSCLDFAWPGDPQRHLAAAEAAADTSPRFGEALVNDYLQCAGWPVEPEPLGPIEAPGAPPILLVSTTGDPATPHAGAVAVAERLASGTLLTHEGDGHTIALQGDGCVDGVVIPYLVSLEAPAAGARC